jgi:DNA-binding CsgD family transcriptional regulator
MHNGQFLVGAAAPVAIDRDPVREAVNALAKLIERVDAEEGKDRDISAREVVVDTEINGWRYLLVRSSVRLQDRIQLSPREREIVRMVATGHPNKVIADVLNISSWTVCTHLRRIFAKLGVGSRAAMVARLPDLGIVSNEPLQCAGTAWHSSRKL